MMWPSAAKAATVLKYIFVISAISVNALPSPAQTLSTGVTDTVNLTVNLKSVTNSCANAHLTSCDGICTWTQLDPNNCGACKHACPASDCNTFQFYLDGTCDAFCLQANSKCGAECVDVLTSTSNYGACGHLCPAPIKGGATCSSDKCGMACAKNHISCNGQCVSFQTDAGNCGACGHLCQTTDPGAFPSCSAGTCSSQCLPGYSLCNGKCVATTSDASNCGSCGKVTSISVSHRGIRLIAALFSLAALCTHVWEVDEGHTCSRSLLSANMYIHRCICDLPS